MNILLNGENKEVPDGISVIGLLNFLKIQRQRVAVELNMEIVRKDQYGETPIKDGDSLEIVSFMGGGADFGCRMPGCGMDLRPRASSLRGYQYPGEHYE
jgi:thiamine biosynthesis protein ThiS